MKQQKKTYDITEEMNGYIDNDLVPAIGMLYYSAYYVTGDADEVEESYELRSTPRMEDIQILNDWGVSNEWIDYVVNDNRETKKVFVDREKVAEKMGELDSRIQWSSDGKISLVTDELSGAINLPCEYNIVWFTNGENERSNIYPGHEGDINWQDKYGVKYTLSYRETADTPFTIRIFHSEQYEQAVSGWISDNLIEFYDVTELVPKVKSEVHLAPASKHNH